MLFNVFDWSNDSNKEINYGVAKSCWTNFYKISSSDSDTFFTMHYV